MASLSALLRATAISSVECPNLIDRIIILWFSVFHGGGLCPYHTPRAISYRQAFRYSSCIVFVMPVLVCVCSMLFCVHWEQRRIEVIRTCCLCLMLSEYYLRLVINCGNANAITPCNNTCITEDTFYSCCTASASTYLIILHNNMLFGCWICWYFMFHRWRI